MAYRTLVMVGAAAVLALSACGSSNDNEPSTNDDSDVPIVAGVCTVEEPDCTDTGVVDGDSSPGSANTNDADDGLVVSDGMTIDGGLTVEEALASGLPGVLAVKGNLFDDGSGARLCSVLAESFPPQCGGGSLALDGFDFADVEGLPAYELAGVQQSGGVSWTDGYVTLFGEIVDGALVVNPLVAG